MAKLTCVLIYLCCFFPFALCATVRHAQVRIENKSSKTLSAVRVRHAYGSIFKQRNSENQTWTNVTPGAATDASLEVEYLTGDPGTDWWQVGWTVLGEPMVDQSNAGNIKFRQTSPANAQGIYDEFVQSLGGEIAFSINELLSSADSTLLAVFKAILKFGTGGPKATDAVSLLAKFAVEALTPGLEKTKGLLGYKQCTLYSDDQNRIVNIRIYDTGYKLQISPADSSNCDTVWKLTTVPWSTAGIF
ncbi:hypothetical protein GMOD_00000897 [Pyrenophora seminiperda CCB06]|uniref:Up-regulated in Daf-2 domain-containing protein n=1 Tax=Pyrenophora seminiperda CCB06 TaxID=1302712 RepID=A0A3M7M8G4_9PLEO|nr:hypothetical protein GMOD_00000897 [Pyrenophora seminiperda CCB06]